MAISWQTCKQESIMIRLISHKWSGKSHRIWHWKFWEISGSICGQNWLHVWLFLAKWTEPWASRKMSIESDSSKQMERMKNLVMLMEKEKTKSKRRNGRLWIHACLLSIARWELPCTLWRLDWSKACTHLRTTQLRRGAGVARKSPFPSLTSWGCSLTWSSCCLTL